VFTVDDCPLIRMSAPPLILNVRLPYFPSPIANKEFYKISTSLTSESDDIVIRSVSSMIQQQLSERQSHENKISEKFNIRCEICDAPFSKNIGLRNHLKRIHPESLARFFSGGSSSVTSGENEDSGIPAETSFEVSSSPKCQFCGKLTTTNFGLKRHLKIAHSSETSIETSASLICDTVIEVESKHDDKTLFTGKLDNSIYRTIRIYEGKDKFFGSSEVDQKLLDEINSKEVSIQLNLTYSGTKKKRKIGPLKTRKLATLHQNTWSGSDNENVKVDANTKQPKQQHQEVVNKDGHLKSVKFPAGVRSEDTVQKQVKKPWTKFWCSKCSLSFYHAHDLRVHLAKHWEDSKNTDGDYGDEDFVANSFNESASSHKEQSDKQKTMDEAPNKNMEEEEVGRVEEEDDDGRVEKEDDERVEEDYERVEEDDERVEEDDDERVEEDDDERVEEEDDERVEKEENERAEEEDDERVQEDDDKRVEKREDEIAEEDERIEEDVERVEEKDERVEKEVGRVEEEVGRVEDERVEEEDERVEKVEDERVEKEDERVEEDVGRVEDEDNERVGEEEVGRVGGEDKVCQGDIVDDEKRFVCVMCNQAFDTDDQVSLKQLFVRHRRSKRS
jgi:hypothetical protein